MPTNPEHGAKPVKRDGAANGATKFFLAGCAAEIYLLFVRKFYINGTIYQVVAWDGYLQYLLYAGLALLALGVILAAVWRKDPFRLPIGGWVAGTGAFLAASSWFIRAYVDAALSLLCVVVPVAMILAVLWCLYDRECAWALTILGTSLVVLWVLRRELASMYLGKPLLFLSIVYLVVLALLALAMRQADHHGGKLGKLTLLPEDGDPLPVYVACGLSIVAIAVALISTAAAYYTMWALAIVVFALAVYYTVKQL